MHNLDFNTHFRHPTTKILGSRSLRLDGKRIALGITGSVAAFLSPQIARELIREGATIFPIMTKDSLRFVGKDLLWWATGVEPIVEITGNLEHIWMAGVMNDPIDLMLILPATTNTVSKLAYGIADTSVTLVASSLQGKGVPLQILCVAHEDLINSPAVKEAIKKLKARKVLFIDPKFEEGKAKVPPIEDVVFEVLKTLTPKLLKNKELIITGGPTREFIDNVRFITNAASGKSSISLAIEGFLHGGKVSLVLGPTYLEVPGIFHPMKVISAEEMYNTVKLQLETSKDDSPIVILTAAISDFSPTEVRKGKIKSGKGFVINLKPTDKLSDMVKTIKPNSVLVVYKAEWDVTREQLILKAKEKMKKTNADIAIANDLAKEGSGFGGDTNSVILIRKDGKIRNIEGLKSTIAYQIIQELSRKYIKTIDVKKKE